MMLVEITKRKGVCDIHLQTVSNMLYDMLHTHVIGIVQV